MQFVVFFGLSTSELQHGPVLPHFRHHVPACLQDKVAVDELSDARDGESDFRVHNAEVKVQMDVHSLEPGDDPLEVHPCLVHHQLPQTPHASLRLI